MIPYYMIVNAGTLLHYESVRTYPRHLVLAPVLARNSDMLDTVREMIKSGVAVILDNGAYEGELMSTKEYAQMVAFLQPTVAVLPDLPNHNHLDSRDCSMDAWRQIRQLNPTQKVMYQPQGVTREQVLKEYSHIIHTYTGHQALVIGLGLAYKHWLPGGPTSATPDDEGAREHMVVSVMNIPNAHKHKYHILGGRWEGSWLFSDNWPNIKGLDTAKPCNCALAGQAFPCPNVNSQVDDSMDVADYKLLWENMRRLAQEYNLDISRDC